jgi:small-conductance mechanosensitive channel
MNKIRNAIKIMMFGILFFGGVVSAQSSTSVENTLNPYGTIRNLVSSIQKWSSLYQDLENEKIALQFEQEFDFPSQKKRQTIMQENVVLQEQYDQKKNEIELEKTTLEDKKESLQKVQDTQIDAEGDFAVLDEQLQQIEREIALLEKNIMDLGTELFEIEKEIQANIKEVEELGVLYEERQAEQIKNIAAAKENILKFEEEIAKQEIFVKNEIQKAFYDFLILVGIIVVLLVIRYISKIIIRRLSGNLSQKRTDILINLNKIFFNVVIIIVLVGLIFSQIVNLLPFIAILSTGIAFAVRDSIACFIGWFVIGTDRGYKVGHIIRIEELFGQVKEIGPILTRIHEFKGREKTGKFISIPNKFIFEKEIVNLSQNYNITQENIVFLMDPETDMIKAKSVLETIIKKSNEVNTQKLKNYEKRIEKNAGIHDSELNDHVVIRQTVKGPELNGKFFASFETINQVKEAITTQFLAHSKKDESITIKYLNY